MRSFSLPDVLEAVGITAAEQKLVEEGQLVKGVVESTTERELAVKFAFVVPNLNPGKRPLWKVRSRNISTRV